MPLDRLPPAGWPAIRPVRVHGRDRWQVDERPHGGRHVHATEERARAAAHVARLAFGNAAAAPLPVADHVDAVRALELLRLLGATLLDAAREFASRRSTGAEPCADALSSWLDARRGAAIRGELSRGQSRNSAWAAKAFAASPMARSPLRDLDTASCQRWIDSAALEPGGKDGLVRQLSAAWNWLARMGRAPSNPWQGVRVPRPPEAPEVTVLSPKDAARLLRSCRPSPAVWRYALAGLALGLRPSEAARVTRASLRDGHLEVAGRKTNQTRFLSLDAGLWRAFTAGKGQHPGDLPAGVLRRLWREARDRAAVTVPPDALRHSFASYWLPIHADRPRLAELMGNSPEIIARHYRRPVPAAVARRYWQAIAQEIRHVR